MTKIHEPATPPTGQHIDILFVQKMPLVADFFSAPA